MGHFRCAGRSAGEGAQVKTAPITVTEMLVIGGVCVAGFVAWRAYTSFKSTKLSDVVDNVIPTAARAVDVRQTQPDSVLGKSQSWVDDTVRKGQDAGASSFITSFFTGLTK